jgi:FAD/FMN-containing dehydrogenase
VGHGSGHERALFGATSVEEARAQAEAFASAARGWHDRPTLRVVENREEQECVWRLRESGLAATAHGAGQNPTWPGWEDSAVHPRQLGAYLRDLRALFDRFEYTADLYGHFGQGCVHCRIDFDLASENGIRKYRAFMQEAADLVVRHGGSLSGEHGDGQARGELLGHMFSREMLDAFREFKSIWDPAGLMNPGKLIDARPLDTKLRLGADLGGVRWELWSWELWSWELGVDAAERFSSAGQVDEGEPGFRIAAAPQVLRTLDYRDFQRRTNDRVEKMAAACGAVTSPEHDVEMQRRL